MQARKLIRRSLVATVLLAGAFAALPAAAQGSWPTGKAITYVVPFPPGGNTDTLARLIAQPLSAAPRGWAIRRASVSVLPPGGKGTT